MNAVVFVITVIIVGLVIAYIFFSKLNKEKLNTSFTPAAEKQEADIAVLSSNEMMNLVEKIEIESRTGHKLMLSNINNKTNLSTKKFQEITANGTAIGANIIQGAMPALGHAQTLAQIAKAAPNGLLTSTAPLSELIKYKDGTVGSIVMRNGKILDHAGFQEVVLEAVNPAAVIGAGMQAMAMISGQYYMHNISKQLEGIERGIDRLIGFHHDQSIGKLRSIENMIYEVVNKQYPDDTDIIALQTGIRESDGIFIEYYSRLERLSQTGEIAEIQVRKVFSRLSAAKELKSLRENTEEQELYYSFQICLFASKLKTEGKKAEFATRMKMGETEKAREAFNSYYEAYTQSFINNADDFLNNLFEPINEKADALVQSQWRESKRASEELSSLQSKKTEMNENINFFTEKTTDEEIINSFNENRDILYIPATKNEEQRIFISAEN